MRCLKFVVVLLCAGHVALGLDLTRFLWMGKGSGNSMEEPPQIIEVVRWRQPVCILAAKDLPTCVSNLRKYQTEYEQLSSKELTNGGGTEKSRKPEEKEVDDDNSSEEDESIKAGDQLTTKIVTPEVVEALPYESAKSSLTEVTGEDGEKTLELNVPQVDVRKAKYLEIPSFGRAATLKPPPIYVTKVLDSPVTAVLVAHNCVPDIGVPLCDDYQTLLHADLIKQSTNDERRKLTSIHYYSSETSSVESHRENPNEPPKNFVLQKVHSILQKPNNPADDTNANNSQLSGRPLLHSIQEMVHKHKGNILKNKEGGELTNKPVIQSIKDLPVVQAVHKILQKTTGTDASNEQQSSENEEKHVDQAKKPILQKIHDIFQEKPLKHNLFDTETDDKYDITSEPEIAETFRGVGEPTILNSLSNPEIVAKVLETKIDFSEKPSTTESTTTTTNLLEEISTTTPAEQLDNLETSSETVESSTNENPANFWEVPTNPFYDDGTSQDGKPSIMQHLQNFVNKTHSKLEEPIHRLQDFLKKPSVASNQNLGPKTDTAAETTEKLGLLGNLFKGEKFHIFERKGSDDNGNHSSVQLTKAPVKAILGKILHKTENEGNLEKHGLLSILGMSGKEKQHSDEETISLAKPGIFSGLFDNGGRTARKRKFSNPKHLHIMEYGFTKMIRRPLIVESSYKQPVWIKHPIYIINKPVDHPLFTFIQEFGVEPVVRPDMIYVKLPIYVYLRAYRNGWIFQGFWPKPSNLKSWDVLVDCSTKHANCKGEETPVSDAVKPEVTTPKPQNKQKVGGETTTPSKSISNWINRTNDESDFYLRRSQVVKATEAPEVSTTSEKPVTEADTVDQTTIDANSDSRVNEHSINSEKKSLDSKDNQEEVTTTEIPEETIDENKEQSDTTGSENLQVNCDNEDCEPTTKSDLEYQEEDNVTETLTTKSIGV